MVNTDVLITRIAAIRAVADRVVALELESADPSAQLPPWTAGSHVDVHLTSTMTRQYSLSTAPHTGRWRLAVLEEAEGRGGSTHVHERLRVGDTLHVSHPRNNFPFRVGSRDILFVAGGIGITPIVSMIAEATAAGGRWTLLYLSRTGGSAAFIEEFAPHGHRVHHRVGSRDGAVDLLGELDTLGAHDADVYACGPARLLNAVEEYARSHPGCRLNVERFSAGTSTESLSENTEFTVELNDGTEVTVGPAETILEALGRVGIRTLSSCQEGLCGTCETTVLGGVPDHRDHILGESERASGLTMMPCVSRCFSERLILDL